MAVCYVWRLSAVVCVDMTVWLEDSVCVCVHACVRKCVCVCAYFHIVCVCSEPWLLWTPITVCSMFVGITVIDIN